MPDCELMKHKYLVLFTPAHLAVLVDWLEEKKSLCVEIYIPHGGGSSHLFNFTSLAELKGLILKFQHGEIQITIWKNYAGEQLEGEDDLITEVSAIKWIYSHCDEVMYFSVTKNRNRSDQYDKNPEKYAAFVEKWLN
jgi:hypothetical protein